MHIEDVTSSKVFIIDELRKLRNIIPYTGASESHHDLKELLDTIIIPWNSFDKSRKIDKFKRHLCHELNFFLLKRDRPFFDEIVLPIVSGKLEKHLVDWYLLSESMPEYRQPIMKNLDALAVTNDIQRFEAALVLETCFKYGDEDQKARARACASHLVDRIEVARKAVAGSQSEIDRHIKMFEQILNSADLDSSSK